MDELNVNVQKYHGGYLIFSLGVSRIVTELDEVIEIVRKELMRELNVPTSELCSCE